MDESNPQGPLFRLRALTGLVLRLDGLKAILVVLPFLCLGAYWADAPIPIPSILLPERHYFVLGQGAGKPEGLGSGDAFLALPGRLVPGRSLRGEDFPALLPDSGVLEPVLRDLESGLGPFARARVFFDEPPLPSEISALQAAAGEAPLAVEVGSPRNPKPVQALGVTYTPLERRVAFELLLGPAARTYATVEVRTRSSLLLRSPGSGLPADLVLRLSVDRSEASDLAAVFLDSGGRRSVTRFALGTELEESPKVLVVSSKKAERSAIEALYHSRRVTPEQAADLDLLAYELVVLDGVPLGSLRGRLLSGLLDVAARRTGSLLFAADSPDFGRRGDNPELEAILPVTLLPRSLKDLPDIAMLILVDVSGSMFGDKLSLAKVTGLELLRNLKPSDRVGLLLFSDERRWLYPFQLNSGIAAAPALEPLTAGGGTDLHPALAEGVTALAAQPIGTKHAVLITDGVTRPADFHSFADRARELGVSISTMGVGADVNRPLLERLALKTGGRYYAVDSVEAIPTLLFEDRMSEARATFRQGKIPILAVNGQKVSMLSGMAQYTPSPTASVLFASDVGDPLLAGQETGNRAVLFFGSDLYGTYTSDFFASSAGAGGFKDRLDALFARKPVRVRVVEAARGLTVLLDSESLVEPGLVLSKDGSQPLEASFRKNGPGGWTAELVPPLRGTWSASIQDRGGSLASFRILVNGGFSGVRSDASAALEAHRVRRFRPIHLPWTWLVLFFASSLACTVVLRVRR